MRHTMTSTVVHKGDAGWLGVGAIALLYSAMYTLNLWLPLETSNHTTRIWDWSQAALTAVAAVIVMRRWRRVSLRTSMLGLALGTASGLSHCMSDPSFWWNVWEGVGVLICFVGGVLLFQELRTPRVSAFDDAPRAMVRSIAVGIIAGLPLVAINTLYFVVTAGNVQFREPLVSAFRALSPGIHEEIIFRFFVLGLCLSVLREARAKRLAIVAAVVLAVVPHSLNHLPDLLLANPLMAFGLLTATSLLFGLPMALMQLRRNLEAAITLHWFVDFMRFLFGY